MRKLATLLLVVATATSVDAKPKAKDVKAHMDKAAKAHKAGKFELALTELQAAYELDPQPKLLFAIGQVYAKLDNCEAAIDHYEKFSAATKDKSKQAVAKQAIDACKQKLADHPTPDKPDKPDKGDGVFRAKKPADDELPAAEPVPAPEQQVDTEAAPIEAQPAEPAHEIKAFDDPPPPPTRVEPVAVPGTTAITKTSTTKPWYRDPLGDALVITGVAATVGSFFTYRAAQSEVDAAEGSTSLATYDEHRNNAERNQLYTVVLAGGGIALVTAGVLRYALRSNHRETLAIVPTGGGGVITWSGGF